MTLSFIGLKTKCTTSAKRCKHVKLLEITSNYTSIVMTPFITDNGVNDLNDELKLLFTEVYNKITADGAYNEGLKTTGQERTVIRKKLNKKKRSFPPYIYFDLLWL
jgi:hypothetical protein